jgi:hypothetical protein
LSQWSLVWLRWPLILDSSLEEFP